MQFPVIITGIGIFLLLGIFGMIRQQWRAQKRKRFKKTQAEENLRIVRENRYQAKKICNANERAAYTAACAVIWERQRKERVFVQVSLGEIIMHPHGRVHAAINSKRVDLLVTDEQFNALIAIEIDGSGHHLTNYSHIMMREKLWRCARLGFRYCAFRRGRIIMRISSDKCGKVWSSFLPSGSMGNL